MSADLLETPYLLLQVRRSTFFRNAMCAACFEEERNCDGKRPCDKCLGRQKVCEDVTEALLVEYPERAVAVRKQELLQRSKDHYLMACDSCKIKRRALHCSKEKEGCTLCKAKGGDHKCNYSDISGRTLEKMTSVAKEAERISKGLEAQSCDHCVIIKHRLEIFI